MPLSEELRDQIARIIDPGVAMMLFDHGHRNQWGHESWEKTLSKADQILVLLERAKAQALGGGREISSAVDESAASLASELTDQERGASLDAVDALLDALADAERQAEDSASQHIPTAPARHFCRGKANGLREAWEIVLRYRITTPLAGALKSSEGEG